ncbi:MAG: MerR family transcriptional regulator [Bacteroidales bacterium]|nr:MerR family transcriptional regulator [Bacteroidales bacterium]MDY6347423.1 MerR family transcriptional regulator [Bacteroidales bacterium]
MESDEIKDEKLWFGIGEVSSMLGIPASTLRFWEKEFGSIKPCKNRKGDRFYSKNDITLLKTIQYLTKTKGFTIQGARNAMKSDMMKEIEIAAVVGTLQSIKEKLLKIKDLL